MSKNTPIREKSQGDNLFERIKAQVSIRDYAISIGAGFIHGGHGDRSFCPIRKQGSNNPAFSVDDENGLYYCFSCGEGGDVITLAARYAEVTNYDAALALAEKYGIEVETLSPEERQRLDERRWRLNIHHKKASACYSKAGHLTEAWWERRGFDKELRERFLLGGAKLQPTDATVWATIPYWYGGDVHGMIARRTDGVEEGKYRLPNVKTDQLPDDAPPLFMPRKVGKDDYFLVEGVIDALAIAAAGYKVVALIGTEASNHRLEQLRELPGDAYIIPDADEAGESAARKWVRSLYPKAYLLDPIDPDGVLKDPADLLARDGLEVLKERLAELKESGGLDAVEVAVETLPAVTGGKAGRVVKYLTQHVWPLLWQAEAHHGEFTAASLNSELVFKMIKSATKLPLDTLRDSYAAYRFSQLKHGTTTGAGAEELPEPTPQVMEPGVLERYAKDMARINKIVGDSDHLKLAALVAVSAQLAVLPNDQPLGTSLMLIAAPGRGKNKILDGAVKGLPEEWYLPFESASAKSFYYATKENPDLLRHKFLYPNEAEATDMVVEFLRPMLSSAKAKHLTVNKNADGSNMGEAMEVNGPITAAIPTVRNRVDWQLQSRLLVSELKDYSGRVKFHTAAVSDTLHPDFAAQDFSSELEAWQQGLRSLTGVRRVVFPLTGEYFHATSEDASARVWKNICSLMLANAWLEQHNREVMELANGETAIVATPEDYEVAYNLFKDACERTRIELNEDNVKILDAMADLKEENKASGSRLLPSMRMVAEASGVPRSTVQRNKEYLAKIELIVLHDDGKMELAHDITRNDWHGSGDIMAGYPRPAAVREKYYSRNGSGDHGRAPSVSTEAA